MSMMEFWTANRMKLVKMCLAGAIGFSVMAGCGSEPEPTTETTVEQTPDGAVVTTNSIATANQPQQSAKPRLIKPDDGLILVALDCGSIGINDLGIFASDGSLDGQVERFASTCYYIQHPDGTMIWDTGLPGLMAGQTPTDSGVFQISLKSTLTTQLEDLGIDPATVDYVSVSHSHFDHIGQIDQFSGANWLLHDAEWAHIQSESGEGSDESTLPIPLYESMQKTSISGDYDVFGDGSVVIFETPGHTPGHTSLLVNLPQTGAVLLTGDLYHRVASRNADDTSASKVPSFNTDEAMTRISMADFEARAKALNAKVVIQHAPESFPEFPYIMR